MKKNITVLRGDGIGPEIVSEAIKVLDAVGKKFSHEFIYTEVDIGGCSIDKYGVPITEEGMAKCKASDSVLLTYAARFRRPLSVKAKNMIYN